MDRGEACKKSSGRQRSDSDSCSPVRRNPPGASCRLRPYRCKWPED